jgi:hypothetical protein
MWLQSLGWQSANVLLSAEQRHWQGALKLIGLNQAMLKNALV